MQEVADKLSESIYGIAAHMAEERNLNVVMELAGEMFLARNAESWNVFINEEVLPGLKRRGEAEMNAQIRDMEGKRRGGRTDEQLAEDIKAVREQYASLIGHATEHLIQNDKMSEKATKAWADFLDTSAFEKE